MNPRTLTPSMSLLLAFEASARHQSYTRAAEELSLTQSAVSRQVQALEELLEVRLFQRKGRRIELTDVGRMYMRGVGVAITGLRNATLQAIAYRSGGGILNLAVLPTFGARWLMPRLHSFYAANPNVIVHMHSRIGYFDLETAGVDAVIGVGNGELPGLISHRLLEEELVVVASPDLLARHPIKLARDLGSLLLLRVATRPNVWQEWFDACNVKLRGSYLGPTFELTSHLIQAVATGIGVGLVPRCLVEEELQSGNLIVPFEAPYVSGLNYYFAYPTQKADLPSIAAFRDWLLAIN
ncbi:MULTISPECIES: LysR substrate-binding domain-containing protein [Paraburkholderia]|uniref:Glycine cleavage system transcriptional activator n=1 Tax=Paraburkholderia rhynchosiae TaxID=487049 RepID=A0A2N7WHM0_9BURK|nr:MULTISPECIES: LysR substrate-binding domain-containing protein [Paraburkholderia]PMS28795.1 LysR family transcriptional regulator [Paraburkholderia rhynchosiae]CAB3656437.1 Glycine cleavage system transcriptional activator [Paraburkholderia rhynchosiae]CAD6561400.1 Glycine cleavage system transcriptional activator [Paraburkholderia kirstenboschensis]